MRMVAKCQCDLKQDDEQLFRILLFLHCLVCSACLELGIVILGPGMSAI